MRKDKKNKAKVPYNIPMVMACVLFCLTLFSTHFTSNLYARYTTSDEASDGARVIKFGGLSITEEINGQPKNETNNILKVIPGVDIQKQVLISFDGSEADTFLFVAVQREGWTFEGEGSSGANTYKFMHGTQLSWEVDAYNAIAGTGWKRLGTYVNGGVSEEVYYIRVDSNTKIEDRAVIKDGIIKMSEEGKNPKNLESIASLTFRAEVVQANGFNNHADEAKNAQDAWWTINDIPH